jgi:hypothetical protein
MVYQNGDRYEGNWRRGKKQGFGEQHYSDGKIYKGEWVDDLKVGEYSYMPPELLKKEEPASKVLEIAAPVAVSVDQQFDGEWVDLTNDDDDY